jgi:hypothetical protein
VLFIVIVLGADGDLISDKVSRVKTHTELSNHADISTSRKGLHKSLGTGLGNGTEVVDKVSLGHTNTRILNGKGLVSLVRDQANFHCGVAIQNRGVSETHVTNLIKSIRGIGNQLSQKDFLVGIKGVDNQRKELIDISRKSKGFLVSHVVK